MVSILSSPLCKESSLSVFPEILQTLPLHDIQMGMQTGAVVLTTWKYNLSLMCQVASRKLF